MSACLAQPRCACSPAAAAPASRRRDRPARRLAAPPRAAPETGGEGGGDAPPSADGEKRLGNVNPIALGRRARSAVDGVWKRVLSLGAPPGRGTGGSEFMDGEELDRAFRSQGEFSAQAVATTVLVLGATGRVGTILVRKLSLRGYTVRALVRNVAAAEGLPQSVTLIEGDVGDPAAVGRALAGAQKVVYCARARSTLPADLANVEKAGVSNVIKALLDASNANKTLKGASAPSKNKVALALFKEQAQLRAWTSLRLDGRGRSRLEERGSAAGGSSRRITSRAGGMGGSSGGYYEEDEPVADKDSGVGMTPEGDLRWGGVVSSSLRGGEAQVAGPLEPLPAGFSLASCDGLVMRVRGDGKRYSALLGVTAEEEGELLWYSASFATRTSWAPLRLPFAAFRPLDPAAPPLEPGRIARLGFRFETRAQPKKTPAGGEVAEAAAAPVKRGRRAAADADADFRAAQERQVAAAASMAGVGSRGKVEDPGAFGLDVAFVKALPGGTEPDLIFVSCAGGGLSAEDAALVVPAKRTAEALVRNSGLGYTILRPGQLLEAPGGARALLFDQGGRITEGITCADVADVLVRSLHDEEARNRSFDVCHEYTDATGSRYELLAHVPTAGKGSYLTPALKTLEKNT